MRGVGFAVLAVMGVVNAQMADDDYYYYYYYGTSGSLAYCEQACTSYYGAQFPFDWGYNTNNDIYTIEAELPVNKTTPAQTRTHANTPQSVSFFNFNF